jgi:hypothetical protein
VEVEEVEEDEEVEEVEEAEEEVGATADVEDIILCSLLYDYIINM